MTKRTDAVSTVSTFAYDELDRLHSAAYSDGTPTITNVYDAGTDGKGRRTSMTDGIADRALGRGSFVPRL